MGDVESLGQGDHFRVRSGPTRSKREETRITSAKASPSRQRPPWSLKSNRHCERRRHRWSVLPHRQTSPVAISDSQYCSLMVVIGIAQCQSHLRVLLVRVPIPSRNRSRQSNNLPLLLLKDHNERRTNQSSPDRAGSMVIASSQTRTVSQ
jgi:hypothetical protein